MKFFPIWNLREGSLKKRAQKECKIQISGRTATEQWFRTGQGLGTHGHPVTMLLHKTCLRHIPLTSQHGAWRSYKTPSLAEEPLTVDGYWKRHNQFLQGHSSWWVAHVSMGGPKPMYIWSVVTKLSSIYIKRRKKKRRKREEKERVWG